MRVLSLPVFQFPGWSSSQGGVDLEFLCPRTFSRIVFDESFEPRIDGRLHRRKRKKLSLRWSLNQKEDPIEKQKRLLRSVSVHVPGCVTPRIHATTSARVISTHSHSRRLIIFLATRLSSSFVVFPRSAGSLPSNINMPKSKSGDRRWLLDHKEDWNRLSWLHRVV